MIAWLEHFGRVKRASRQAKGLEPTCQSTTEGQAKCRWRNSPSVREAAAVRKKGVRLPRRGLMSNTQSHRDQRPTTCAMCRAPQVQRSAHHMCHALDMCNALDVCHALHKCNARRTTCAMRTKYMRLQITFAAQMPQDIQRAHGTCQHTSLKQNTATHARHHVPQDVQRTHGTRPARVAHGYNC